ncbi:MAG: hypothetical protein WCP31_01035 [Chloroflexales bacterium]
MNTAKGYPKGVLLSVDVFMRLRALAQGGADTLPLEGGAVARDDA